MTFVAASPYKPALMDTAYRFRRRRYVQGVGTRRRIDSGDSSYLQFQLAELPEQSHARRMENAAASSDSLNLSRGATQSAPSALRYTRVAMLLHWVIAALVLSTLPLGWFSTSSQGAPAKPALASGSAVQPAPGIAQGAAARPLPPPKTAAQQSATNLHKTVGIVILLLTVLRVGWRLTHRPPALPESMARSLRWLARSSHGLFYLLLLVMPLSGWWMSSAVPDPRRHAFGFGIFDIPFLPVTQSWASAGAAKFVHTNLVWLMVGLAVLHIGAALKHQFVDKDDVLKRMLPQRI